MLVPTRVIDVIRAVHPSDRRVLAATAVVGTGYVRTGRDHRLRVELELQTVERTTVMNAGDLLGRVVRIVDHPQQQLEVIVFAPDEGAQLVHPLEFGRADVRDVFDRFEG